MPTSASSWQCLKLVGSMSDLLLDQTNSKEVLVDDGGPRTKAWCEEVPVWTYFGFIVGADGSPTLSFL